MPEHFLHQLQSVQQTRAHSLQIHQGEQVLHCEQRLALLHPLQLVCVTIGGTYTLARHGRAPVYESRWSNR